MDLDKIGWQEYAKRVTLPEGDFDVGRVAIENKNGYTILSKHGEVTGILRGKVLSGFAESDFPKVGDWVKIEKLQNEDKVVIEEILPRATKISRKSPHDATEQVIVANIDVVFIVQSLPDDFNLRRLERYLVIAKQSGAKPIIVLNKIDLNDDFKTLVADAKTVAQGAEIIPVSAKTRQGLDELKKNLAPGSSFVFMGSSGVGKSTLVNAIVGEDLQVTREIRDYDQRGRHTTTKREMIFLEDGSILIDTPGMRELGIFGEEEELEKAFEDIDELALQCKYGRCDHEKSDGCAVKAALNNGTLSQKRYEGYLKLKKELAYLESKHDSSKKKERQAADRKQHKSSKKE